VIISALLRITEGANFLTFSQNYITVRSELITHMQFPVST